MKPQILSTWPVYTAAAATRDVFAGVTVAMVAIPLCLAIAIASGVAIGLALRLKRRKVPPQDWTPPDR